MFEKKPFKKHLDKQAILIKLRYYCAYQERCHSEVRSKLLDLGCYGEDHDQIIADLIAENFLNEERFAQMFAQGKFNIKYWGRIRIRLELKSKKVSDYSIKKAINQFDEADYFKGLLAFLDKKDKLLNEPDAYARRQKLFGYAQAKGFEVELILKALKERVHGES